MTRYSLIISASFWCSMIWVSTLYKYEVINPVQRNFLKKTWTCNLVKFYKSLDEVILSMVLFSIVIDVNYCYFINVGCKLKDQQKCFCPSSQCLYYVCTNLKLSTPSYIGQILWCYNYTICFLCPWGPSWCTNKSCGYLALIIT